MKTRNERIDVFGGVIRNQSRRLPGHEDRMVAHCEWVQRQEDIFRDRIKQVQHNFKIEKNRLKKANFNTLSLGKLVFRRRADLRAIREEWIGTG